MRQDSGSQPSPAGGTIKPSLFLPAAGITALPALGAAAAAPPPPPGTSPGGAGPASRAPIVLHGKLSPSISRSAPAEAPLGLPWLRPSTSLNRPLRSPPGRREHSDTLLLPPFPGTPNPPGPKPCSTRPMVARGGRYPLLGPHSSLLASQSGSAKAGKKRVSLRLTPIPRRRQQGNTGPTGS